MLPSSDEHRHCGECGRLMETTYWQDRKGVCDPCAQKAYVAESHELDKAIAAAARWQHMHAEVQDENRALRKQLDAQIKCAEDLQKRLAAEQAYPQHVEKHFEATLERITHIGMEALQWERDRGDCT